MLASIRKIERCFLKRQPLGPILGTHLRTYLVGEALPPPRPPGISAFGADAGPWAGKITRYNSNYTER